MVNTATVLSAISWLAMVVDYDSWLEHDPGDDKRVCEVCGEELVELEDEEGVYYDPHECELEVTNGEDL